MSVPEPQKHELLPLIQVLNTIQESQTDSRPPKPTSGGKRIGGKP
jgi:hypothetical protein